MNQFWKFQQIDSILSFTKNLAFKTKKNIKKEEEKNPLGFDGSLI
jgi:hypothetical protein